MKLACRPSLVRASIIIDHGKLDKEEIDKLLAASQDVLRTIPVYETVLLQAWELVDGFCTEIPFEDATETLKHNVLYLMETYDLFKDFTNIDKALNIVDHMLLIMDPHERSHLYDYKYKDITDKTLMSMISLACNEMASRAITVTDETILVQFCVETIDDAEMVSRKLSGKLPEIKLHGTFIKPDKKEKQMVFENGENLTRNEAFERVQKEIEEAEGPFENYIAYQLADAVGVPRDIFKQEESK